VLIFPNRPFRDTPGHTNLLPARENLAAGADRQLFLIACNGSGHRQNVTVLTATRSRIGSRRVGAHQFEFVYSGECLRIDSDEKKRRLGSLQ